MRAKSQASVAVRQFLRTSSDHGGLAGCRLDVFHRLGSFLRLLFVKFCKQAHGLHIEITKSQGDTTQFLCRGAHCFLATCILLTAAEAITFYAMA